MPLSINAQTGCCGTRTTGAARHKEIRETVDKAITLMALNKVAHQVFSTEKPCAAAESAVQLWCWEGGLPCAAGLASLACHGSRIHVTAAAAAVVFKAQYVTRAVTCSLHSATHSRLGAGCSASGATVSPQSQQMCYGHGTFGVLASDQRTTLTASLANCQLAECVACYICTAHQWQSAIWCMYCFALQLVGTFSSRSRCLTRRCSQKCMQPSQPCLMREYLWAAQTCSLCRTVHVPRAAALHCIKLLHHGVFCVRQVVRTSSSCKASGLCSLQRTLHVPFAALLQSLVSSTKLWLCLTGGRDLILAQGVWWAAQARSHRS